MAFYSCKNDFLLPLTALAVKKDNITTPILPFLLKAGASNIKQKHYGFVINVLRGKLVCICPRYKYTRYSEICQFTVNYESVMF
jgi:hypothetical protein